MSMFEIAHFNGGSDAINVDFVERIYTPIDVLEFALRLHLSGLLLSQTVSVFETYGISRARSPIHNWVQKADLEPEPGRSPDRGALDETVVKVAGDRYWLFAAVDTETGLILHVGRYMTRNNAVTKMFLRELAENHEIEDAEFLVDGAPCLHAGLFALGMHFRHETVGDRNPVERIFQEIKRRINQFYNTFARASPERTENWLQAIAWSQNNLL